MALALLVPGCHVDVTAALLRSQVILPFGLPFTSVPLLWLTRRTTAMGTCANRRLTCWCGRGVTSGAVAVNAVLTGRQLHG
jgi:manganese transport protein